jgi:hypothetical protein
MFIGKANADDGVERAKFNAELKGAHRDDAGQRAGSHIALNTPPVLQRLAAAVGQDVHGDSVRIA